MSVKDLLVSRALRGEKNFIGRDLSRANLRGADLRRVNFYGADLRYAKLVRAKLEYAKLEGADLRGADLTGAKLWDATLFVADLRNAILTNADLRDANLSGAKLEGADFTGAKLSRNQIFNLRGRLTLEQTMSLHGSVGMEKGDILSSETNRETYRVVSIGSRGGKTIVNIVNTKNKKRHTKRAYYGFANGVFSLWLKNRAGDIFTSQ